MSRTLSNCGALILLLAWAPLARSGPLQWNGPPGEALMFSAFDGDLQVNVSGLLDIEAWSLPQTAPGLIFTDDSFLLNPRLSLFLDGQLGTQIYFFAQGRLDRGFDPSDQNSDARIDEYAVRFTPWNDGRLSVQVGRFATVVGNWTRRHLSWDNPFINAPLPYENLTAIWDESAVIDPEELLAWGHVPTEELSDFGDGYYDKSLRVPVIWGPSYGSGLSVAGRIGKFEYAAEMKNSSLSSRPQSWNVSEMGFEYPTFSGRVGYRPNAAWNVGFSASSGAYFHPDAAASLPAGRNVGDYLQQTLGHDISFEWRHFQIWSEIYAVRFEVPMVGNTDTLAYYLEAKYKITPQLFGALRWNQQFFGDMVYHGGEIPWGRDIARVDAALGYRFNPKLQLKLQYSVQNERWANSRFENTLGAQVTLRF